VYHCGNIQCSSSTSRTLGAPMPALTSRADVTIGVDDMPLIFGYTSSGNDLVAIHCSNDACLPSVRRD